jgi:hypothetical protein
MRIAVAAVVLALIASPVSAEDVSSEASSEEPSVTWQLPAYDLQ